jgi:hypothetical protein
MRVLVLDVFRYGGRDGKQKTPFRLAERGFSGNSFNDADTGR